jgi:hypothetical protein
VKLRAPFCGEVFGSITDATKRPADDIGLKRSAGKLHRVRHLSVEEQMFVLYQIRNWLFGREGAFKLLNDAWSVHGAEAYFWE